MKNKVLKKLTVIMVLSALIVGAWSVINDKRSEESEKVEDVIELTWYQLGEKQKDTDIVLEKVNDYLAGKIGVKLDIVNVEGADYTKKMHVVINTGSKWDLCFSSSWANDYLQNADKGAFLALDDLVQNTEMYEKIDSRFWEAARVQGKIYGVPSEKELGNMQMWVFTKEYVDKYEKLHTLEDLEPWLKVIRENEPDVIPLYITKDYTAPTYMDKIEDPIGIEYGDETLTVKNVFETERMKNTLKTMRKYYKAGYINKDAATASDDKTQKRFVTKGDGQPYAELIWGKELGYEVVVSPIMKTSITNISARGALTAVNAQSEHPDKAVELLNLINTDVYLRNLLNYGIEGIHWEKVEVSDEEAKKVEGKPYIYDTKWATFKEFNDASEEASSFGFDFNLEPVSSQVAGFRYILDEFGKALYTGSVDPDEYLPKLLEKLDDAGVQKVIDEMQRQVDVWKEGR